MQNIRLRVLPLCPERTLVFPLVFLKNLVNIVVCFPTEGATRH